MRLTRPQLQALVGTVLGILMMSAVTFAQTTIYWKKDHVYAGPGGKEIAVITPAPSDQTVPTTPSSLASSNLTATSVQLSWSASTDSGGSNLAGYKVYRQRGSGASLPIGTVGTGTLSFVDQPLIPATAYTYTIVAFDNAQNHSTASGSVTITTSSVSDSTAPATPTGLTGYFLTRTSVRLTWNRSIDTGGSGTAGYKVYRGGTLISGATPLANPTYDDTGLAYVTTYAYTVTAIDNATNASTATSALNLTTDRELLVQDNFNRLDGALGSPWTADLGAARHLFDTQGVVGEAPIDGHLKIASVMTASSAKYPVLLYFHWNADTEQWDENAWAPIIWSQAALQPSTNSFKATVTVVTNTSSAGILFYGQAVSIAAGDDPAYSSTKGYRAVLTNNTVVLQYCTDLNYMHTVSTVCSTVASASSVPTTGTLSVETNAATGSVKVYVNGTLKITSTISTSVMSGALGLASLGYYDYNPNIIDVSYATTYHTATLDNFLLERN